MMIVAVMVALFLDTILDCAYVRCISGTLGLFQIVARKGRRDSNATLGGTRGSMCQHRSMTAGGRRRPVVSTEISIVRL